jgi:uncharacterized membrane protein YdbT with pleckstrin-like domain
MGYTDKYLLEGEHVTYRTHLHWIIYIYPILLFIVSIVICGLAVKYCTPKKDSLISKIPLYVGYAIMAVSAIWMCIKWISQQTSEFAVTNRRIIIKSGIFQHEVTELRLNKSESLHFTNNVLGNLLNYGNITVSTGDQNCTYKNISDPEKFRYEINKQIDNQNNVNPTAEQQNAPQGENKAEQQ